MDLKDLRRGVEEIYLVSSHFVPVVSLSDGDHIPI